MNEDVLVFDTTEWSKEVNASIQKMIQEQGPAKLTNIATKVKSAAQKYCPVETGRLRSAIIVTKPIKTGSKISIQVGVTLESLETASAHAVSKILASTLKSKIKSAKAGGGRMSSATARGIIASALEETTKKVSKGKTRVAKQAQKVETNYGVFVEFGTSKMKPQPFMRPALAEVAGLKAF